MASNTHISIISASNALRHGPYASLADVAKPEDQDERRQTSLDALRKSPRATIAGLYLFPESARSVVSNSICKAAASMAVLSRVDDVSTDIR